MKNEFELKPFDKVLVRDKNTKVWVIDIFEKYEDSISEFCYKCMTSLWKQCIPYKGNEHLLGTTESPQEECPKEETEKKDEVSNNYGYPVECFKRKDLVLCRDGEGKKWCIDVFLYNVNSSSYPFRCNNNVWRECIPYEGNEHLIGTNKSPSPEQPQTKENKKNMEKIKNEDIQKLVSEVNPNNIKALIAYSRLCNIAQAWNKADDFTPDFSNMNQTKWFPWFVYSDDAEGFVFANASNAATYAYAYISSRLCFMTRERAEQFGTQFIGLWNDLLLNNKTNM